MDNQLPQPVGESPVSPVVLSPEQEDLCQRLDDFHARNGLKTKPSNMFRGAVFVSQTFLRNNQDWIAQAANSLRDILYPFYSKKTAKNIPKKVDAFKNYGSVKITLLENRISTIYGSLSELAHHSNSRGNSVSTSISPDNYFEGLIADFELVMGDALLRQMDIHNEVDSVLALNPAEINKKKIEEILNLNPDAKRYFFSKADERWLDFLYTNGLLDAIKQKSEDPTQYMYSTPELGYLDNIADKVPEKIANIILKTPISDATFNPEVIDRFIRITAKLPADQISKIVPKIRDDKWIVLMKGFNRWGFDYEEILKRLFEAQQYESIIVLGEAILALQPAKKTEKTGDPVKDILSIGSGKLFYLDNISSTNIFTYLASVDDAHTESALAFILGVYGEIVKQGERGEEDDNVFEYRDTYHTYDIQKINLFTHSLGRHGNKYEEDDILEILAVIKTLLEKTLGIQCEDPQIAKTFYEKYVDSLPQSRSTWRLRLFALSLCPETFRGELWSAFNYLFDVMSTGKRYYEIDADPEYQTALGKCFGIFAPEYQRQYIENVFTHFAEYAKNHPDERWHLGNGWQTLSSINGFLTDDDRNRCEKVFGRRPNKDFVPEPVTGEVMAGTVVSQGPISQDNFDKLSPEEIANNFRGIWSPKSLRDEFKATDDYLNPHNAEGAGDLLKESMPKRLQDFVDNADKFFKRDVLDTHYTYAFLRGIEDIFRKNKPITQGINWDGLIKLLVAIKTSGEANQFEQDKEERSFDAWLAGWTSVHDAMADVVQQLLIEESNKTPVDFPKHRDSILGIISYLLTYPDPTPKKESLEDPVISTTHEGQRLVSDPHSIAINTVRGRAFQAFVYFIYPDGRELPEGARIKVDTKALYEEILAKEDTRALMFMFGHYLPQFYFREIAWMQKLIPQIFPEDEAKSHLYLAAWEGYLLSSLYKQIFEDPNIQPLYYRGIDIAKIKETTRQYSKDPEEGIANHIALAFMHFSDEFNFDHPLFKEFWEKGTLTEHGHFIDFLGRSYVTGGNSEIDTFVSKNESAKENLKKIWEWVLDNRTEPELFGEFGFWVNVNRGLFEIDWLADKIKRTLEKSKGKFKRDYELTKSIVTLSQNAPEDALKIAELVLLIDGVRGNNQRRMFYLEGEWQEALQNLYQSSITKQGTYRLIDDLIREGGSTFWGLKSIIENSSTS